MQEVETIEKKIEAVEETLNVLPELERQTIVHCKHFLNAGDGVRIWRSTFLVEKPSGIKRKLIHAENISMHPTWTVMDKAVDYRFTLYFEGLSKECVAFDLLEEIPQPGGFVISEIPRNKQDVYQVTLG